jgi:hypothetical protein
MHSAASAHSLLMGNSKFVEIAAVDKWGRGILTEANF